MQAGNLVNGMSKPEEVVTVVQPHDQVPADESPASFTLVVIDGPDAGKRFAVPGSAGLRLLVGTSHVCELRLTDPTVSRRHATLEPTTAGLKLVDTSSTNGTWVDRLQISGGVLIGDELVRMGQTTMRVELDEVTRGATPVSPRTSFGRVTGASVAMRRLYSICERLANVDVSVIIEGETGTGKEVLAEAIHEQGPRAGKPFIIFDCTSVPASLIESELFGHERGAFTGANDARKGVFEQANGGTLLIDEIGDLDLAMQPKLLRALERREVRRVGGSRWIPFDVRILAATRRNLDHEIQNRRFRDDLFHRLAVARIELPPLRERSGDIEHLARAFWTQLGGDERALSASALARWADDPWPGNVRELRNAVARFHAFGDLPASEEFGMHGNTGGAGSMEKLLAQRLPFIEARDRLLDEFTQRYVERLLEASGGDVGKAAAASGIGRRYFQKLKARGKEEG